MDLRFYVFAFPASGHRYILTQTAEIHRFLWAGIAASIKRWRRVFRDYRQHWLNHAAQGRFGYAGEVLGENATIVEVSGVLGPADADNPVAGGFRRDGGDDLRGGNHQQRLLLGIKRPDSIGAREKLHWRACRVVQVCVAKLCVSHLRLLP